MSETLMPKILVVEDNPALRTIAERIFRSAGAEVFGASNLTDGLRLQDEQQPHLVVSDLNLRGPGGNAAADKEGLQIISHALTSNPAAAAILMSGTTGDLSDAEQRDFKSKGVAVLGKPVRRDALLQAADNVLGARSCLLGQSAFGKLAIE